MGFLKRIEEKWRRNWEEARLFEADPDPAKPKCFITVAYPYPNSPQHIGHARTYTLADVHARYMRMRGYNVLLPMAFHYTGTPVLAMAKRLADNDEDLVDDFINVYKVPKEKLKELTEPIAMAHYFHEEIKSGMKEIGYSIDWRREFTTTDPHYNRFIEWQFRKLQQAGYITRGSHPVGWCPKDGNPVGQHDTVGDVEPDIGQFTLIKFRQNELIFPTATLRPETVFGVTNIWLNPAVRYVKALVDAEKWVISQECAEKLRYLNRRVTILETFEGKECIGTRVENPVTKAKVLILPADFADPKNATGVVMSVPGHAPYDYVALEGIKRQSSQLEEYRLDSEEVSSIEPIYVITTPDHPEVSVGEVVKKMGIHSQLDKKLEDATKEVYRHEFHGGRMKQNTGKYSGLAVAQAKEKVEQDLISSGSATTMYELLNTPVLCRCRTECVVKIFEDQWFIDYGKPEWKTLAHRNLESMEILPEELRAEFNNVIDWLHEKACARKSGMGTRLPWDQNWIIESLSDSTIYMAYYTIVRHIKEGEIQPAQLTDDVFDYIFLGKGEASTAAKKASLGVEILGQMRDSFLYFYPLDSRHSGRDLVPNHLTFMIFNHTAIFPEKLWPRQIATNGSVMMEGVKMSKSFGNIIPLRQALADFGADPVRLGVLATAELLQDAEFSPMIAKAMRDRLERLCNFALGVAKAQQKERVSADSLAPVDRWMLSRLQDHIGKATEAMNKLAVRKAIHSILYELDQDLQWYQKRIAGQKETSNRKDAKAYVSREVLDAQIRMLAPVAPHTCEELWEILGGKGFVSASSWPEQDESKIDLRADESETLVTNVMDDTQNITKATGMTPSKVCYYVAAPWKWKVYIRILEETKHGEAKLNDLMKEFRKDPALRGNMGDVAKFASKIIGEVSKIPENRKEIMLEVGMIDEREAIEDASALLQERFKAQIMVYSEEDSDCYDPKLKAAVALPYRPAIYIE